MSIGEFQDRVDGILADYTTGLMSEREFKGAILNLLLEVCGKKLETQCNK